MDPYSMINGDANGCCIIWISKSYQPLAEVQITKINATLTTQSAPVNKLSH